MMKDVLGWLNYSVFAEIALIGFLLIFLAVVIRTLTLDRSATDDQANSIFREPFHRKNESHD